MVLDGDRDGDIRDRVTQAQMTFTPSVNTVPTAQSYSLPLASQFTTLQNSLLNSVKN